MDTKSENKRELTKAITLLLRDFEIDNGVSVDFISLKKKNVVDKDGNNVGIREVRTYYTEDV